MTPLVEVCSPADAERIIRALGPDPEEWNQRLLHGHVDAVCREQDGSVAWEIHQPNVITDFGRRQMAVQTITTMYVGTSPSNEVADAGRSFFPDDGAATSAQLSASVNATYDSVTLTKTWSPAAFAAPAANRQIGMIGLSINSTKSGYGLDGLFAYTVLSPVKTQTTSQTLEVVYKITLTPIY